MDDTYVIITIDGVDYYIQAEYLPYLEYIDGKLVNMSNDTITLVTSFDTSLTYPYITFNSMRQGRKYTSSSSYGYTAVTSDYTIKSNHSIYQLGSVGLQSALLFVLIMLLGVRLIWKR